MDRPILKASPSRDSKGRFKPGWKGGPGNPQWNKLSEYRAAVNEATSVEKIKNVLEKLYQLAMGGDTTAANIYLTRILGPAVPLDVLADIVELKAKMEEHEKHGF